MVLSGHIFCKWFGQMNSYLNEIGWLSVYLFLEGPKQMVWVNKYHYLRQNWVVLVDLSFGMP